MLEMRRLRVFNIVAEVGSLTAAAQRLYLTQSAVSQQMSLLEREVGVPLLRRVPRGVELTPAGEALADRTVALFADIAKIEQDMKSFGGEPQEIRFGAFNTAGHDLLPSALRMFMEKFPNIRVRLSTVRANEGLELLREGNLQLLMAWDFNFAPRPIDRSLTQISLPDDPLRVLLPKGHRLADRETLDLTDLAVERWVVPNHSEPYIEAYESMCRIEGFEPDVAFRTDYSSVPGMVAAGIGISMLPGTCLSPMRKDIVVIPLHSPKIVRRITVLMLPEFSEATPVVDLVDFLRQSAERLHEMVAVD